MTSLKAEAREDAKEVAEAAADVAGQLEVFI